MWVSHSSPEWTCIHMQSVSQARTGTAVCCSSGCRYIGRAVCGLYSAWLMPVISVCHLQEQNKVDFAYGSIHQADPCIHFQHPFLSKSAKLLKGTKTNSCFSPHLKACVLHLLAESAPLWEASSLGKHFLKGLTFCLHS